MAIMTHAKFDFNGLILTLIFAIWASEPPSPRAWRTTEKAGPDRVKVVRSTVILCGFVYVESSCSGNSPW